MWCLAIVTYTFAVLAVNGQSPPPPPTEQGAKVCSDNVANYFTPAGPEGKCENFQYGTTYEVDDFTHEAGFAHYVCPTSRVRIMMSNGMPPHAVTQGNPHSPCWINWFVKVPLFPVVNETIVEPMALGIKAFTLKGIPIFGPQEGEGNNAVEPTEDGVQDGQHYWGHVAPVVNELHYHSPLAGEATMVSNTTIMGYALDGFPIFGAVENPDILDSCNGRYVDGRYQYHVRTVDQVDETLDYCNGTSSVINWKYILGCFSGDPFTYTEVADYTTQTLPIDCVLQEDSSFNIEVLDVEINANTDPSTNRDDTIDTIMIASGCSAAFIVLMAFLAYRKMRHSNKPRVLAVATDIETK